MLDSNSLIWEPSILEISGTADSQKLVLTPPVASANPANNGDKAITRPPKEYLLLSCYLLIIDTNFESFSLVVFVSWYCS